MFAPSGSLQRPNNLRSKRHYVPPLIFLLQSIWWIEMRGTLVPPSHSCRRWHRMLWPSTLHFPFLHPQNSNRNKPNRRLDPDTIKIHADLADEIDQAFANIDLTLKHAGRNGWSQVFRVNIKIIWWTLMKWLWLLWWGIWRHGCRTINLPWWLLE